MNILYDDENDQAEATTRTIDGKAVIVREPVRQSSRSTCEGNWNYHAMRCMAPKMAATRQEAERPDTKQRHERRMGQGHRDMRCVTPEPGSVNNTVE